MSDDVVTGRRIEKKVGDSWEPTEMQLLVEGDHFRMFDITNEKGWVHENGTNVYVARGAPYQAGGVWGVQADKV